MREWLGRPSSLALLGAVALTVLGTFTLAWRVGGGEAISSTSYAVGYSNTVAWVSALAGCAAAWLSGWLLARERRARGEHEAPGPEAEAGAEGRPGVPAGAEGNPGVPAGDIAILTVATVAAFVLFAYATFGVPLFDSMFFFDRIAATLSGSVPWRDFGFPYGPLLLYVPVGLGRLAALLGAPAVLGYYVTWGLALAAGAPLLAAVLRGAPIERGRKRAVFWIVGGYGLLSVMGGLNYTLPRFLAPLAGLALLARLSRREPPLPAWALGAASLGIALACVAVSPEMGVAYAAASTGMLVALRARSGAWKAALAVQVAGFALAAALLGGIVAGAVEGFLAGAFALPVLPSPFILLYLAAALLTARAAGSGELPFDGPFPAGAYALAGLVLVPSALGRADFGHVFLNGLPFFVAAAALLGRRRGAIFWPAAIAVLLAFVGWLAYYDASALRSAVLGAVRADVAPRSVTLAAVSALAPDRLATVRKMYAAGPEEGAFTTEADRRRLAALPDAALPFGAADSLAFDLAAGGRFAVVDCDEKGPVTAAQLRTVEEGLARARWVLIPVDQVEALGAEAEAAAVPLERRSAYSGMRSLVLLQFPARLPVRREEYAGRVGLAGSVDRMFQTRDVVGRYLVMERR